MAEQAGGGEQLYGEEQIKIVSDFVLSLAWRKPPYPSPQGHPDAMNRSGDRYANHNHMVCDIDTTEIGEGRYAATLSVNIAYYTGTPVRVALIGEIQVSGPEDEGTPEFYGERIQVAHKDPLTDYVPIPEFLENPGQYEQAHYALDTLVATLQSQK